MLEAAWANIEIRATFEAEPIIVFDHVLDSLAWW